MTTRKTDDTESHNSGVRRSEIDAQTILDYVQERGGATLSGIAKRAGATEDAVRWHLVDLKADGLVQVRTGIHDVHIKPSAKAKTQAVADGGEESD